MQENFAKKVNRDARAKELKNQGHAVRNPKEKFIDLEAFSKDNQALKDYNFELRRYWNMQRDFFDP